jgi:hypothetical protein
LENKLIIQEELDLLNLINTNYEIIKTKDISPVPLNFSIADFHFFKIKEVRFDNLVPEREAFEQVISAINIVGVKFIYILQGTPEKINIFLGVKKEQSTENESYSYHNKISAVDIGRDLLCQTFLGNFQGSSVEEINRKELLDKNIFNPIIKSQYGRSYLGVPSISDKNSSEDYTKDFQTIDRLINSMKKTQGFWHLIVCGNPVSKTELNNLKNDIYKGYNYLHLNAKASLQEQKGKNSTRQESTSESNSKSRGKTESSGSYNESAQTSKSKSKSAGTSTGESSSSSISIEKIDKKIQELQKYIDDELLERISLGFSKGMFDTTVYAIAEKPIDMFRLDNALKSIIQGDTPRICPVQSIEIDMSNNDIKNTVKQFDSLTCQTIQKESAVLFLGHRDNKKQISSLMTSRELSILSGLPYREVEGLPMLEGIDFGLNIDPSEQSYDTFKLGFLKHRGAEIKTPLEFEREKIKKHIFIAGVTGSGKTTTCLTILENMNTPFIVIEPVKTEYRILLENHKDIKIFTLGDESLSPFRFNPFELLENESITNHVDMLKAAFIASFPMEAAMPYIMEEAIYQIYKDKGWNVDGWDFTDEANIYSENPWSSQNYGMDKDSNFYLWPTISDFLKALEKIVDKKGFDSRLRNDYMASLASRFSNLALGSKGAMLNCKISHNIEELLEKKVILELDSLKDPRDKSFMIALILSRINEALKKKHKKSHLYRHVTLIEEAHRLLTKPEPQDSESKRFAVTMFADMLSEIRKYGEGLIIVDQIPNKLIPDVIKNTNTKIIHRLFAKDDRESVGDAIGLDDEQKKYISQLQVGETIVFSGGWKKPVAAQISKTFDTSEDEIKQENILIKLSKNLKLDHQKILYPEITGDNFFKTYQELSTYISFKKKVSKNLELLVENLAELNKNHLISDKNSVKNEFVIIFSSLKKLLKNNKYLSLFLNQFKNKDDLHYFFELIAKKEFDDFYNYCQKPNKNLNFLFK